MKRVLRKRFFPALLVLALIMSLMPLGGLASAAAGGSPVIWEVYGGGGNSGGVFKYDYVVLKNTSDAEQSLDGYSLQYAGATGNFDRDANIFSFSADDSIPAGGYFLVQLAAGNNDAQPDLPVTPDAIGTLALGGTAGKVALVDGSDLINDNFDPASNSNVLDLVGYGATNVPDGYSAPATTNSTAIQRGSDGTFSTVTPTLNYLTASDTYKVTYDANADDATGTVPVDENSPYAPDATVTVLGAGDLARDGYEFDGWNTAADGNGTSYAANDTLPTPLTANVTLFAVWTSTTPATDEPVTLATWTVPTTTPATTNLGASWAATDGVTKLYPTSTIELSSGGDISSTASSNSIYAGSWNSGGTNPGANADGYWLITIQKTDYVDAKLNFNSYSTSTGPSSIQIKAATSISDLADSSALLTSDISIANNVNQATPFAIDLSAFDAADTVYVAIYPTGAPSTGNNRLVAVNVTGTAATTDTYTVTYNANGGTGTVPADATDYAANAEVTVLGAGDLAKENCTFDGWNTAADGSGSSYAADATFKIAADTTLYAVWKSATPDYTLNYDGSAYTGTDTETNNTALSFAVDKSGSTNQDILDLISALTAANPDNAENLYIYLAPGVPTLASTVDADALTAALSALTAGTPSDVLVTIESPKGTIQSSLDLSFDVVDYTLNYNDTPYTGTDNSTELGVTVDKSGSTNEDILDLISALTAANPDNAENLYIYLAPGVATKASAVDADALTAALSALTAGTPSDVLVAIQDSQGAIKSSLDLTFDVIDNTLYWTDGTTSSQSTEEGSVTAELGFPVALSGSTSEQLQKMIDDFIKANPGNAANLYIYLAPGVPTPLSTVKPEDIVDALNAAGVTAGQSSQTMLALTVDGVMKANMMVTFDVVGNTLNWVDGTTSTDPDGSATPVDLGFAVDLAGTTNDQINQMISDFIAANPDNADSLYIYLASGAATKLDDTVDAAALIDALTAAGVKAGDPDVNVWVALGTAPDAIQAAIQVNFDVVDYTLNYDGTAYTGTDNSPVALGVTVDKSGDTNSDILALIKGLVDANPDNADNLYIYLAPGVPTLASTVDADALTAALAALTADTSSDVLVAIQDSQGNIKSSLDLTFDVIDTSAPVTVTSIADALKLPLGTVVTIQGIGAYNIRNAAGNNDNGVYVQDETGGIDVYMAGQGPAIKAAAYGKEVQVTGTIGIYNGLTELIITLPDTPDTAIVVMDDNPTMPDPIPATVQDILDNINPFKLVSLENVTLVSKEDTYTSGQSTYYIEDTDGNRVMFYGPAVLPDGIAVGDTFTIVKGVSTVSSSPTTPGVPQIYVSADNAADIIKVSSTVNAETPAITTQPVGATYTVGDTAAALSVAAAVSDGGTLSYQWYSSTTNSTTGGAAITDATDSSYIPSTATAGTTYYYCVVTNTNNADSITGAKTATATSSAAAIVVNPEVTAVTGVTVAPATVTIAVGDQTTLTATVAPANATNKAVTWTSSDPTVATVDQNGVVTAVKAGPVTITVTTADGSFKATCNVTVTAKSAPVVPPSGVTTCVVTFNSNGGSAVPSQTIAQGSAPVMPSNPTKDGYIFAGWYTDAACTKAYDGSVLNADTTFYAKWTEVQGVTTPDMLTTDHIWYVRGYPDGTFLPTATITRAEVSMAIYRLLQDDLKTGTAPAKFSDVSASDWYGTAIDTLAQLNILKGYPDGTFRPNQPITRAELAALVSSFEDLPSSTANPYTDVSSSHWAYNAILSATAAGWLEGDGNGQFRPDDNLNRAEFVTAVNRVLNRSVQLSELAQQTGLVQYTDVGTGFWGYAAIEEASNSHDYTRNADGVSETWTAVTGNGLDALYNQ